MTLFTINPVDSQDMALNSLFFPPHFDEDQRKKMLDVRQL